MDQAGQGGSPVQPGEVTGGAGDAAGGVAAGRPGIAGLGAEGGEANGVEALECEAGRADCDGSKLTGCETTLAYSQRNCGACGVMCEGACSRGVCSDTVTVARDATLRDVVTTTTHAFASLFALEVTIVAIELEAGQVETRLTLPRGEVQIALGQEHLYVFHEENEEIWSVPLDGSSPRLETLTRPSSMGASREGAYYVSYTESDVEPYDTAYTLWFRARGATKWQRLLEGPSAHILSSSAAGVVFLTEDEVETKLYLLDGTQLVEYGVVPAYVAEAVQVGTSLTALTPSDDERVYELWWLDVGEAPVHYPVGYPSRNEHFRLRSAVDRAALYYETGGSAFAQLFNRGGPERERIGLPAVSSVARIDDLDIWFSVWDNWVTRRVMRSRYLDLAL
jgi:hypothetical protein